VWYRNSIHKVCFTGTLHEHYDFSREDASIQPFLPVEETRDKLLSLTDRASSEALWLNAVEWIVLNESNVRVETRQLTGKDFSMWRWIPIDEGLDEQETQTEV
jgi:hypothetical protein